MKKHRFFVSQPISEITKNIKDSVLAHQIKNVLKIEKNENLIFFNGDGFEYEATLKEIIKDDVSFEVFNTNKPETEIRGTLTLYAGIVKRDNFEWICQKAVELGVTEIIPMITARTIKTGLQVKRIETIIKEAVEQSGRVKIPKLGEIQKYSDAIKNLSKPKNACLFDSSGTEFQNKYWDRVENRILFIGPEGGFTEKEIADAKNIGIIISSLGERTLRAETAVVVGCFLLSK